MSLRTDYDDYDDIPTLEQRCDEMIQARRYAAQDEDEGAMGCPYSRDDPRFDAYLNERNRIRAERGLRPLSLRYS